MNKIKINKIKAINYFQECQLKYSTNESFQILNPFAQFELKY